MEKQGSISTWKDDQGFGFITPDEGGPAVFVHYKTFADRRRRPALGARVGYSLGQDERGRPRATRARLILSHQAAPSAAPTPPSRQRPGSLPLVLAGLFMAGLAAGVLAGKLPTPILLLYLAASLLAFCAYALDKSAARKDQRRTPENTLQMLGLVGGWPGALVAQHLLRHKTRKTSFQVTFWATVLLNCGALAWLLTPAGHHTLRTLFGPHV